MIFVPTNTKKLGHPLCTCIQAHLSILYEDLLCLLQLEQQVAWDILNINTSRELFFFAKLWSPVKWWASVNINVKVFPEILVFRPGLCETCIIFALDVWLACCPTRRWIFPLSSLLHLPTDFPPWLHSIHLPVNSDQVPWTSQLGAAVLRLMGSEAVFCLTQRSACRPESLTLVPCCQSTSLHLADFAALALLQCYQLPQQNSWSECIYLLDDYWIEFTLFWILITFDLIFFALLKVSMAHLQTLRVLLLVRASINYFCKLDHNFQ